MASKKFEKGSDEFNFFGDFFKFVQNHYVPENTDTYWNNLLEESQILSRKYRGTFYTMMILAFIDYAEEVRGDNDEG